MVSCEAHVDIGHQVGFTVSLHRCIVLEKFLKFAETLLLDYTACLVVGATVLHRGHIKALPLHSHFGSSHHTRLSHGRYGVVMAVKAAEEDLLIVQTLQS